MKQSALQQYTSQKKLFGQDDQQILDKFVLYSNLCCDPMNIFKYMEQKSICIYLANYWINRASLFTQVGDFKNAMLCMKQASSRNHIVKETQVQIEQGYEKIRKKIVTAMKRVPSKSKRSADQYNSLYEKQSKLQIQELENLINIFQKNYKQAKRQIQKQFQLKTHGKNKSWMYSIYEKNEENMRKISEKIKSLNNYDNFLSMRTPISKKDPMRLTKTMDSVQMLKKKKSTQQKSKKAGIINKEDMNLNQNTIGLNQNKDSDQQNAQSSIAMHTTPVGRQMNLLSRRVTFDSKASRYNKIEKLRSQQNGQDSSKNQSIQKSIQNIDKSNKSISKRGSILKNKKRQNINMSDDSEYI